MQYLISDWSPAAANGKDYKPFEIPEKLEAPIISDLKLADRTLNGGPVVAFTLNNPESVKTASAGAKPLTDYIIVVAEVSIGGSNGKRQIFLIVMLPTAICMQSLHGLLKW